MKTISPSAARADFYQVIKNVMKTTVPVRISSKEGTVVLLSEEEYEGLLETATLCAIPGLEKSLLEADKDIKKGKVYPLTDVFRE